MMVEVRDEAAERLEKGAHRFQCMPVVTAWLLLVPSMPRSVLVWMMKYMTTLERPEAGGTSW